jgi:hypothetical protein
VSVERLLDKGKKISSKSVLVRCDASTMPNWPAEVVPLRETAGEGGFVDAKCRPSALVGQNWLVAEERISVDRKPVEEQR